MERRRPRCNDWLGIILPLEGGGRLWLSRIGFRIPARICELAIPLVTGLGRRLSFL